MTGERTLEDETHAEEAALARARAGECKGCGADLDRDLDPPGACTACWRRRHNGWDPR